MREYPQADIKVKSSVLEATDGYKVLIEFMELHGISLDTLARYNNGAEEKEEVFESSDILNAIEDQGEALEKADTKLRHLQDIFEENFKNKYGFGIAIQEISSDAEGDVEESFWALCDYYKPRTFELGDSVAWTTFG